VSAASPQPRWFLFGFPLKAAMKVLTAFGGRTRKPVPLIRVNAHRHIHWRSLTFVILILSGEDDKAGETVGDPREFEFRRGFMTDRAVNRRRRICSDSV
jgi:hypothetical protein